MNAKKKQLIISLGIGFVCACLGTFLVSQYTRQIASQWGNFSNDLQKKYDEKTKSFDKLQDQFKTLQKSYEQLNSVLAATPKNEPVTLEPDMRALAVPVDETMGWNVKFKKGSHVDVACTMRVKDKNLTQVLLKNILIADLESPEGANTLNRKPTAYLALKPNQASMMVNALGSCKLYFIQSTDSPADYTPIADGRPVQLIQPKKLNLNQLPPPAPVKFNLPPPPPVETEKVALIKGGSQEVLEFSR